MYDCFLKVVIEVLCILFACNGNKFIHCNRCLKLLSVILGIQNPAFVRLVPDYLHTLKYASSMQLIVLCLCPGFDILAFSVKNI